MIRALSTIILFSCWLSCFGASPAGSPTVSVDTIADLVARKPVANERVLVAGWRTPGDWGAQRIMRHDPSSVLATNLGCVFGNAGTGRYLAEDCESGEVDVRWFGAKGDGVTDDTDEICNAMEYASGSYLLVSKKVLLPAGNYIVNGPLRMTNNLSNPFELAGAGPQVSVITQVDTNSPTLIFCGYGRKVSDLRITYATQTSSADAAAIIFVTRNGVGSGFGSLANLALYNAGIGIGSTINYAVVPIGSPASAGSTNIALSYVTDTTGPFIFRESEMLVPLSDGTTQTVIVQGLDGTNVLFQPALTTNSTSGSITLPGLAQNMDFNAIKIIAPGHCGIYWRTGDSGSVWNNMYLNGENKNMGSGVGWLISGASQMSFSGVNNVENFACAMAAVVLNAYTMAVDSLHIEHCKMLDTYASLLRVGEACAVDIQALELANYWTAASALETGLLRVGNNSRLSIGDLDVRNAQGITNFGAGQFYMVKDSGNGTATIRAKHVSLSKDSGIRHRAYVHPIANHSVLREFGDLIPFNTLASFRNVRLDSVGDKSIYLHKRGIANNVTFVWPSKDVSSVVLGINQLPSGGYPVLGRGLHLSGMTAWTNAATISLGQRPLVTENMYLNVSNSVTSTIIANTGLQRRRYNTTVGQLSGVCEVITPAAHGLQVGQLVFIGFADDATFNGSWEVLAIPSTNSFQYYSYGPPSDLVADADMYVERYPTVSVFVSGDSIGQISDSLYGGGLTQTIAGHGTNVVAVSSGVLNTGLPGGTNTFFRADGTFSAVVNSPSIPTNNGAYVLFVTNGVASWIAHP